MARQFWVRSYFPRVIKVSGRVFGGVSQSGGQRLDALLGVRVGHERADDAESNNNNKKASVNSRKGTLLG